MNHRVQRESPLHAQLAALDPFWGMVNSMSVAAMFPSEPAAGGLGPALCDASALARMVVRGARAADFLSERDIVVPRQLFAHHAIQDDGVIVACGPDEYLVEDGCRGDAVARLAAAIDAGFAGVSRSLRQDVSLLISGQRAAAVLASTCSYQFAAGPDFVMTRVAGVSCGVLQRQFATGPAFQLWADGTYGPYLWETLLDIVREQGGGPAGLAAFFSNAAFAQEPAEQQTWQRL